MNKLLTIAVLSLSFSGFALADDAGDFSDVVPTMGQPYDGQILGRAGHPEPIPTSSKDGLSLVADDRGSIPS